MEYKKPIKYNQQFLKKVINFAGGIKKEALIFFQNGEEDKQQEFMFLFILEMAIERINMRLKKINNREVKR
jgi:hypothetical protein